MGLYKTINKALSCLVLSCLNLADTIGGSKYVLACF